VILKTTDSQLWDAGIAGVELATKLFQHNKIVIDFCKEAPDIKTTELEKMLDYLHEQGFKSDQIEIITGNLVEEYDKFQIVKDTHAMYELPVFQKVANQIDKTKQIQKHFGCFIGRSNINRLIMAGHLWSKYRDQTLLTYHYNPGNDYHRKHLGLEDVLYYFGVNSEEFRESINLIQQGPITLDTIDQYPIDSNNNIKPCKWYKDIFVDVVCETFSNGNVFFATEKFWRAVATKTPFIVQGPQFFLSRLKQLGFLTFDQWWDEGYDQDPYLYSQKEIKKVLSYLGKLDLNQINQMYQDMQSILDHNYNCMMNLSYRDLARVK
jgi:hypothetical protein